MFSLGIQEGDVCRAFTLIELLVVIAIILTLAGILIASPSRLRAGADGTITKQRLVDVQVGLRSRFIDENFFEQVQDTVLQRRCAGTATGCGICLTNDSSIENPID